MRHPTRSLTDYAAGELTPARKRRVEQHVLRCPRCRDALDAEETLRHRLRNATTPSPSDDLFERILSESALALRPIPGSEPKLGRLGPPQQGIRREAVARRKRTALALSGCTAVVAAATLTAAYALGSETPSVDSMAAGASTSVTESFRSVAADTPSTLSAAQIEQLRQDGWFCPELHSLGFQLERAEARRLDGRPTLELHLSDGRHDLVIYEQRSGTGSSAEAPVNAATGNTVLEDGFENVGGTEQSVWLHPGRAWQLVIESDSATYTVVSTLPVSDMPRAVSQLMFTEHSQLAYSRPEVPHDPVSRIIRGLGKLAEPAP